MKKALCITAIALLLGTVCSSPVVTYASEVTASKDNGKPSEEEKQKLKEKMNAAIDKWNTLTESQKKEVYTLIANQQKTMNQLLDKYVELGMMEKTDAEQMKAFMKEDLENMQKNSQCPLMKGSGAARKK